MAGVADLGVRLQKFREERGLTQSELGRRAGMAGASVSHFETGQRLPSLDSLVKLADALGITTDALLGRTELAEERFLFDPVLVRASKAKAETLDTIRRVAAAILGHSEEGD